MRRSAELPLLSLLIAVIAAAAALAQKQQTQQSQEPAGVEGTVTNALTGEPLLRAHVGFRNWGATTPGKYGALTDAQGRFSIKGLPPGQYWMTAERVGFVPLQPDGRVEHQVVLRPGQHKDDVSVKLVPTGAISGRVTGANGEPVEGIDVATVASGAGAGPSRRTDENGRFRIGGLHPGQYRVKASPTNLPFPPEVRTDGTTETHYAPTWYPNSLVRKSGLRVQVQAGRETSGIEIALVQTPIVCVSGRVAGIPPEAEGVYISAYTPDRSGTGGPVRPDGSFRVCNAMPGRNTLVAGWRGPDQTQMRSAAVELDVGTADIDNVELAMIPPFDIPGRVEIEDAPAVPSAQPARTVVRRVQLEALDPMGSMVRPAEVATDGSFKLEKVPAGRFRLRLSWEGYVRAMRLGDADVEGSVLDVRYGSGGAELTLLVSTAMGELSGTVRNEEGNPVAAMVGLIRDEPGDFGRWPSMMTTAEKGEYTLRSVTPGKYRIVVAPAARFYSSERAADEDDDSAETIEIRANEKLTKDLILRKQEDE